jgi:hypothetical protein
MLLSFSHPVKQKALATGIFELWTKSKLYGGIMLGSQHLPVNLAFQAC